MTRLLNAAKEVLKRTVYRPGTIARILYGPLRGYRFMLRETPNWASILGRWEPDATRIHAALIKPGEIVFDCGANVGMHSLHFAKLVGPKGRVFAFEPLPAAARDVLLNCALNNLQNVTVLETALSNAPGKASFKLGPNTMLGSLDGLAGATGKQDLTVQVTSLDQVLSEGVPPPDFVKIDIEGAEGAALEGYTQVARSYPTFAIDLHTPEQDLKIGRFLARHDYDVYRIGDDTAERDSGQREALRRVRVLDKGWPDPNGIWGTVVAIHPSRDSAAAASLTAVPRE